MGKVQSKRSVDITTETKKGTEDENTEKMEKIEDLDKKEVVNGDATISDKSEEEKKYYEEAENDKDMTTEKGVDVQASGDAMEPQNVSETVKDDGDLATAEEISPLADESVKKSKKEKVKKKWSFRSISFGKKDKQKPAKNDDDAEDVGAATNAADTNEKIITEPKETQKDQSAKKGKTTENHENGNDTPNELNSGEQKENNPSDSTFNDITANTTAETCEPVQNKTVAVSSELSEKSENTAVENGTKIFENATVDDASNNGNGVDEKINATEQEPQKTVVSVKSTLKRSSTSPSTNGEVIDQIHQNGGHGESEQEVIEKSKEQTEVNSNTDKKVYAATLDSISSKSTNPSHVQIHLTASSEKDDEIIQINNDESVVILKSTDIEINFNSVDQFPHSEIVDMVNGFDNEVHMETVSDLTSETVNNIKSFQEKLGVDPSPPPLPISPPPSQVSVFAFTNNEEPVEDSNQTKNAEPSICNKLNKANEKEIIPILIEPALTEICNRQEFDIVRVEQGGEETIDDQASQLLDVIEIKTNVEVQTQASEEIEEEALTEIFDKDSKLLLSGLFEKSQLDEETTAETAVKVVEQIKCDEEQILDKSSEKNDIINENDVEFNDNKDQNDEEYIADKKFKHEIITCSSIESPLVSEQINNYTTECFLDITASDLIQCQDELVSLKKSDNVDEEISDPTKDIANTKDFQDVIVAEITQELPVVCE